MAWQNEMVIILRHLINDLGTPLYDSPRLEETILVAAHLIQNEIDFDNTYTIDVGAATLSPDPTTLTIKDTAFISLTCLKAMSLIAEAEAKTYTLTGMVVKDGPSSIDMGNVYKGMVERAKEAHKRYEQAKIQYQAGNSRAGEAVLGPYTDESVDVYEGHFV